MNFFIYLFVACLVAVSGFPNEQLMVNSGSYELPQDELGKLTNESNNEIDVTATEATNTKLSKSQGNLEDREKLVKQLFTNYNKKVNPDQVTVQFQLLLFDFQVLESRNVLENHVWIAERWTDSRMAWEPEEYGGVEVLRIDAEDIWKPDITIYNSADLINMVNCWNTNVLLYSNGSINFIAPCQITTICSLLKLKREPYGEVDCNLKFGSWSYDGNAVDLQFFQNQPEMELSQLSKSTDFEIVKNVAERHSKTYPCCVEPYTDLTYNLTIKRIPNEELFKRL